MVAALTGATLLTLAACGGDEPPEAARPARVSVGAAPSPVIPIEPVPVEPGPPSGDGGGLFADVFGPATGRRPGIVSPDPEPAPEPEPAPTPEPEPAPPVTEPPVGPPTSSPPTSPPVVTEDPTLPARDPAAPFTDDLATFVGAWTSTNDAINADDPTIARLGLTADAFVTDMSLVIPGGTVAAAPIDGGLVAVLLDVDGSVAGVMAYGSPAAEGVFSATITTLVALTDPSETDLVASTWDSATTQAGDTVIPAVGGGHWVVSSSEDGTVALIRLQDLSSEWVESAYPMFLFDALLLTL